MSLLCWFRPWPYTRIASSSAFEVSLPRISAFPKHRILVCRLFVSYRFSRFLPFLRYFSCIILLFCATFFARLKSSFPPFFHFFSRLLSSVLFLYIVSWFFHLRLEPRSIRRPRTLPGNPSVGRALAELWTSGSEKSQPSRFRWGTFLTTCHSICTRRDDEAARAPQRRLPFPGNGIIEAAMT